MCIRKVGSFMESTIKFYKKNIRMHVVRTQLINNKRFKQQIRSRNFTSSDTACTFRNMSVRQSVDFIDNCFHAILAYSSLDKAFLKGKRILEIGHGENIGLALKFLLSGASHVTCLDKFYATRDSFFELSIYEAMRETLERDERTIFDTAVAVKAGSFSVNEDLITCHYGHDIADAVQLFGRGSFDIIVSNAVLEHVCDLEGAFRAMDNLLKPGGRMVHVVDFKDHGMFSSAQSHPLTFLTIPGILYRLMTSHSGQPNRHMIDYYRKTMDRLEYDSKIFIAQVVCTPEQEAGQSLAFNMKKDENSGVITLKEYKEHIQCGIDYTNKNSTLISEIRPYLISKFKKMTDEDLLVASILLVGRKSTAHADNVGENLMEHRHEKLSQKNLKKNICSLLDKIDDTDLKEELLDKLLEDLRQVNGSSVYCCSLFSTYCLPVVTKYMGTVKNRTILELGPGKNLGVGVLMALNGARRYYGLDIKTGDNYNQPFISSIRSMISNYPSLITEPVDNVILKKDGRFAVNEDRVSYLENCSSADIHLEDSSVDFVYSFSAFEHFDSPELSIAEISRVLKPGGISMHGIDLRDHADFSKPYEFLKSSRVDWRNTFSKDYVHLYTNQWRAIDFVKYFQNNGFEILEYIPFYDGYYVSDEQKIYFHTDFQKYSVEELSVLRMSVVARKR